MIQVDLPAAFAIGQVFALLSKKYLKKEKELFKNKLTGPLNLYLSCGYSPVGLFLLIGWPAWEIMYVTGWVEQPYNKPLVAFFYIAFLIAMVLLGNLGFILAHSWYKKGKDKWVIYGAIIGVILTFLPFLLKWGVWFKVGTYAEVVEGGGGYSFFSPPFFHGWLPVMLYFVIITVVTGLWFKKKGNQL